MSDARKVIASTRVDYGSDPDHGPYFKIIGPERADAILAALDAAGFAIVGKDFVGAVRDLRCPSDRINSIGACFDGRACGCAIGLHLTAAGAKT